MSRVASVYRVVPPFIVLLLVAPVGASPPGAGSGSAAPERVYDEDGRLVWEFGAHPSDARLAYARHWFHAASGSDRAKGASGGGDVVVGTDCASDAHKLARWRWTAAYSALTTDFVAELTASGTAWDDATAGAIFAGVAAGKSGEAGTFDGVNQFEWEFLGASTTIAVTTTWYYRVSGVAVESDAQYNTHYAWATDGRADAMDVANIATHEIGHTFGLDHPRSTLATSCLTMYAYADFGETQKRTLGDGDVLGIRKIYG